MGTIVCCVTVALYIGSIGMPGENDGQKLVLVCLRNFFRLMLYMRSLKIRSPNHAFAPAIHRLEED